MIEAAGGLLWRKEQGVAEIAIVHRTRYGGDWTLPKGKLEPDELPLAAALREVKEETGYQASVLDFLGVISYQTSHGEKRVLFWNMEVQEQPRQSLDTSEVVETVWLSPQEALQRMSYPLERAILEVALEGRGVDCSNHHHFLHPSFHQELCLLWKMQDIAHDNLTILLPLLATRFDGLCREIKKSYTAINAAWAPNVKALLQGAEQNSISDPELAWGFAKDAERMLLFGEDALHPGQANARAASLLKEAREKIPNWRGEAIHDLLDPQKTGCVESVPVWKVVEAIKLADGHHDNSFRKLRILRSRLRIFGGASAILTLSALVFVPKTAMFGNVINFADHPHYKVLALILMGLTGAVISVLTSTKSISSDRVPIQQAQTVILMARLSLGTLSALAVVTILNSGTLAMRPSFCMALAAALVSGFSERFLLDSIDAFVKKQQ